MYIYNILHIIFHIIHNLTYQWIVYCLQCKSKIIKKRIFFPNKKFPIKFHENSLIFRGIKEIQKITGFSSFFRKAFCFVKLLVVSLDIDA